MFTKTTIHKYINIKKHANNMVWEDFIGRQGLHGTIIQLEYGRLVGKTNFK